MSKKQTRKTVSLNRAVHEAVTLAAAADGIPASEWVTRLIRTALPGLPPTVHVKSVAKPKADPPAVVDEPAPPPEPAVPSATAAKPSAPVASCALCVDGAGIVPRPLGKNGATVKICVACDTENAGSGRYNFGGGRSEPVGGDGHRHNGKWVR